MKIFDRVMCALGAALLLWVGASWMDITADNDYPNPQHSEYNFFILMTGGQE